MHDDRTDQIIENLLHETAPRSISLRVVVQKSKSRVGIGSAVTIKQSYIETAGGQRYLDEWFGVKFHKTTYADGKECAEVMFSRDDPERQDSVTIGRSFALEEITGYRTAPEPLRYYHVGMTPLYKALPTAEQLGDVDVIGRPCEVFHFKDVGLPDHKQSLVYSLDRETSVPLRVAAYSNPDRIAADAPNWTWEARTLDLVNDHHYPRSSLYSSNIVKDTGDGRATATLNMTRDIQTEEIAFNVSYPKSTFWPIIESGVQVNDFNVGSPSRVASNRATTTTPGKAPVAQTAQQGTPIRVEEPSSDSSLWIGGVGAVLSLAVLAVAFLLMRRGR